MLSRRLPSSLSDLATRVGPSGFLLLAPLLIATAALMVVLIVGGFVIWFSVLGLLVVGWIFYDRMLRRAWRSAG
jgi:hypothetical protein